MSLAPLIAAILVGVLVYLAGLALIWSVLIGVVVFVIVAGLAGWRLP